MNYFVIDGTFKNPVPVKQAELEIAIKEHIEYLKKGFDEGWILVSGPKAHSGGGIIIMKADTVNDIEAFLDKDPLLLNGVQEYRIIEFRFHDGQEVLRKWFE